jgi:hypothetical protein
MGIRHTGFVDCLLEGLVWILNPLASSQHIPIAVYTVLDS